MMLQMGLSAVGLLLLGLGAQGVDIPWYHNAIIYQLYPRSWLDTDGDGIGDLKGVLQKVDYLASLGIDAVWFSPIYPSPNKDFGYDISDFEDVNPEYGTLQDFDDIIRALNNKGIKVLLDFVPNHSSTEHRWFKASEKKEANYTDFYVWKDPKGRDSSGKPIPPNNWLGVINTGSAWEWSETRQQFYLHNFLVPQADLNFANPKVIKRMNEVLRFWMRRGVYGFRVDAISWVWEEQQFKDEPHSKTYDDKKPNEYSNLDHIYTMDQPQNIDIVEDWRSNIDTFSQVMGDKDERIMILESYSDINKLIEYYGTKEKPGATFPFNFILLLEINGNTNATVWADKITSYYKAVGEHWTNWVLGNHDQLRVANRWGPEWVDILHLVMMTLRGTAITYYGEEIGLEDNSVRWDQAVDFQGIVAGKNDFSTRSRDFERGPMPWDSTNMGGFSNSSNTWVPLAPSYWWLNVKAEQEADRSHLKLYQQLAKLRKTLTLTRGDCTVKGTEDQLLYVIRSQVDNPTFITAVNIGDRVAFANLKELGENIPPTVTLLASSLNYPDYNRKTLNASSIELAPKTGIVVSTQP